MKLNSSLFLFFILLLSLYKSLKTEIDPDFFWYLKDAEYILKYKKLPKENIYTFLPSKDWVAHSLGFEILLYFFYKNFKDKGVILFKLSTLILLFSLIIIIIYKKTNKILIFLILYLSAYTLIFWGTTLRPHIFTYIFSLLILYILEKRKYFLITFLLPLWSFFHAGMTAGIGISFIYIISEFLKGNFKKGLSVFSFTFTGILLVFLINPYHFDYFLWIYSAFTQNIKIWSKYITEWESIFLPIFFEREIYYIISFLIMIFILIIFTLSREKKEIFHILLLMFIFYSAIKHVRNLPLFGIISAFILPPYSEKFFKFNLTFEKIEEERTFTIILILLCTFIFLKILSSEKKLIIDKKFYPVKAVKFLKENFEGGNILCPSDRGGFIEFNLSPEFKISVDGRLSVPSHILEEHFKFWNFEINPFDFIKRYPTDFIITENKIAIKKILEQKFKKIYQDEYFSIFKIEKKITETYNKK